MVFNGDYWLVVGGYQPLITRYCYHQWIIHESDDIARQRALFQKIPIYH